MTTHWRQTFGAVMRPLTALLALAGVAGTADAEAVVGEPAPDFALQGSDGNSYTLEALLAKGTKGVVLAFFPKAFTPG
jgi:peroxiredoxin Q/BCP